MVSILMIFVILITMTPWDNWGHAFDPDKFTITDITLGRTYDRNRQIVKTYILIEGTYLRDAQVGIITDAGGIVPLNNRTYNSEGAIQFEVDGEIKASKIKIESKKVTLNESTSMPTLTGLDRIAQTGTDLNVTGTNLNQLQGADPVEVKLNGTIFSNIDVTDDQNATFNGVSGDLGLQEIVFTRTSVDEQDLADTDDDININIKYTYQNQFTLTQPLVIDDLQMIPKRGEVGDKVFFKAKELDEYDVFFIKNKGDLFEVSNKAENPIFRSNAEGDIDILTVEVPNIELGEYYIYLTNRTSTNDPMSEITQEKLLDDKFNVVEGKRKATIISVQPDSGPDSGSDATISGQYLGTLNIDGLSLNDSNSTKSIKDTAEGPEIELVYGKGAYNGNAVNKVIKRVKVIIGNRADFKDKESTFNKDLDRLKIVIQPVTDAEIDATKDVVVETITELYENKADTEPTYIFTDRAELLDGYTFIPSKIEPEIESVTPEKIQVTGTSGDYEIPEDRMFAIHGENFMIHKFENNEGKVITRYPKIIVGDIVLDKNTEDGIELKVIDASGDVLDGSKENEIGTKIIVTIPKGRSVDDIGKAPVTVINPVRNSEEEGLSVTEPDMVEFVDIGAEKSPVIESVIPDVVTIDGGENVTINGSNFQDGVVVYIDGEEINNIDRSGDGKTITFVAPPGREGDTQLQVMNPEGGMDTVPFYYVKTYTNPIITDFTPKEGNTGTLVIVTGDNFLKSDPTTSPSELEGSGNIRTGIYKLIGTRVLLEGEDINEYNLDTDNNITLAQYSFSNGDRLFYKDTDENGVTDVKVQDYYNSLILKDQSKENFYTIELTPQRNIVLSDGVNNSYEIVLDGEDIRAEKVGDKTYDLEQQSDSIIIKDGDTEIVTLDMKTPYKVDGEGQIVGNKVKVVDKNKLHFTVPILNKGDGYYDLTVQNPDTKKDSRIDEDGFRYFTHPNSKPKITAIDPTEGSTEGGYKIKIIGEEFKDISTEKSTVYINGIEISPDDTEVSIDGTKIIVVVPPYPGDLSGELGTDRLSVPVVVINPDGANASLEKGFTYIVPRSHPEITRVLTTEGTAAGGTIVEIIGKDFRYFEPWNDDDRDGERDDDENYQDLNGNGQWEDFRDYLKENTLDDLKEEYGENYENIVRPILPKIYFGPNEAQIMEASDGYLKVLSPPYEAGKVDLYIVNNDSGISNKVSYNYISSNPSITSIRPAMGKKQGGDNVEIYGSGFVKSEDLDVETAKNGLPPETLVRFGDTTNNDLPRLDENGGLINSSKATVNLSGRLKVEYNGITDKATVYITEEDIEYSREFDFDGNTKYIDTRLLLDKDDNPYQGQELIRLEIRDRRLFVERGYAPEVDYIGPGQLKLITPSYHEIGIVDVTVINPDGGTASTEFEYKNPDSSPRIINMTKEGKSPQTAIIDGKEVKILQMTYKGGNIVSVIGTDFRENAKILISDILTIEPGQIDYTLPTKMTFTMPSVPEDAVGNLHRVTVLNEDSGQHSSDQLTPPIYIQFIKGETEPQVDNIDPNTGPATGGTKVKITGNDFREGLKVYFGGTAVPEDDINVVDYKTIYVITPPHEPGTVQVKIENSDGSLAESPGTFTYISVPKIRTVVDPEDETERKKIDTISITGGETIKVKGTGFMPGARVIFNPVLKSATGDAQGETIYIDGEPMILESGNEGTSVEFIDSSTLTVVTPEGKIDTQGIIVINPDGGATDIYADIRYTLPQLQAPLNAEAELVYDRYIKVHWSPVEDATGYEIYVVTDDDQMEFIGFTELTDYIYYNIEPKTRYKFVIKAVGDFGSSEPSDETNRVKTGSDVGPEDTDGELDENTTTEKVGNKAVVNIGTRDADEEITIDLTEGILAGSTEVSISMPADVVTDDDSEDITVIGSDYTFKFNPNIFGSSNMEQYDNESDAGVRFTISYDSQITQPKGEHLLSKGIKLWAEEYVGNEKTTVSTTKPGFYMALEYDRQKANMRRIKKVFISRYNEYQGIWENISTGEMDPINTSIDVNGYNLGKYAIFGTRR